MPPESHKSKYKSHISLVIFLDHPPSTASFGLPVAHVSSLVLMKPIMIVIRLVSMLFCPLLVHFALTTSTRIHPSFESRLPANSNFLSFRQRRRRLPEPGQISVGGARLRLVRPGGLAAVSDICDISHSALPCEIFFSFFTPFLKAIGTIEYCRKIH